MREGDRAYVEVNSEMHHCVVALKSKGVYMFINEFGEEVAKVQLFWSTKSPGDGSLTGSIQKAKADCSAPRKSATEMKCCEAPACGAVYKVKRSDLARGWGRTCSKSCAAKLREYKKAVQNG